jgi:hypothetical protein
LQKIGQFKLNNCTPGQCLEYHTINQVYFEVLERILYRPDQNKQPKMKRSIIILAVVGSILTGCAAVQSIVRSTFPYTATLVVPASANVNTTLSSTSQASSFDQIFTGQGSNTDAIQNVRISSAKLEATNPSGQSMGVFKSIRMYLSRGDSSSEVLVASRDDIGASVGSSIMLDIDNSRILDDYIKGSTVRVRMEYVLRNTLSSDLTLRTSLGFSVAPSTAR